MAEHSFSAWVPEPDNALAIGRDNCIGAGGQNGTGDEAEKPYIHMFHP